jgi:hypothetical protein
MSVYANIISYWLAYSQDSVSPIGFTQIQRMTTIRLSSQPGYHRLRLAPALFEIATRVEFPGSNEFHRSRAFQLSLKPLFLVKLPRLTHRITASATSTALCLCSPELPRSALTFAPRLSGLPLRLFCSGIIRSI